MMSEDQIKEAARKYANQSQFKSDFPHDWNSVNDGFIQGVKLVLNLGVVSKSFYCQREIEDETKCEEQCDHCKEYYKPIERQ